MGGRVSLQIAASQGKIFTVHGFIIVLPVKAKPVGLLEGFQGLYPVTYLEEFPAMGGQL